MSDTTRQGSLQLPSGISMAGRRALVTGAANGIGRATALVLAELGADLVIVDRAPLGAARAEVEARGRQCVERQGDLADDAFLATLFDGDPVAAVAHCAAVIDGRPWREDANWKDRFHRTMDINVRVPLQLATDAIDHMAERGGGAIVLIGSVAGHWGGTSPNTPPDYAASKGGVHALVRLLSRGAVGRGVNVNGVAPGPVETAMTRGFNLAPELPMRRLGKPEELAWVIAFLCTPGASYMSGAVVDVNGGTYIA